MKKIREKGITLIALVITIIILLILAAITINLVLGKNGLLLKAEDGKIETEIAKEKEILSIATVDAKIDTKNGPISNEDLMNALKNNSKEEVTVEGDGPFTVTFKSSKREYIVQEDGTANRAPKHKAKGDGKLSIGDGTEENPYLIQSIEDLVTLSNKVDDGTFKKGDIVKLDRDLDFFYRGSYVNANSTEFGDINEDGTTEKLIRELTKGKGFRSIGYIGLFEGTFDGQGNKIKNLRGRSLFGYVGNARVDANATPIIKNLDLENINVSDTNSTAGMIKEIQGEEVTLENCNISGNVVSSGDAGGFIGYARGANTIITIKNCKNKCNIKGNSAAGLVTSFQGGKEIIINNCSNEGTIQGEIYTGGLGAFVTTKMTTTNSYNKGKIISNGSGRAGGLFSKANGTIEKCYNEGEILAESPYAAGGIASEGYASIKRCYNKGNIITTLGGSTFSGGIYAISNGVTIEECYNAGNIIILKYSSNPRIGGIVGQGSSNNTIINKCCNIGKIIVNEGGKVDIGGIAYLCNSIANSYNLGNIETKEQVEISNISGIVVNNVESIDNCYNLGKIIVENKNRSKIEGIGKATNLTNTYYLKGTAEKGSESVEDSTDVVEALSQSDILTKMNEKLAKLEGWKAVEGKYPVLNI